jgi:hypothetical protein
VQPRRSDALAVLVIYVVPLALVTVGLLAVGLPQLALALVLIEAAVVAAVVVVKRRPAGPSRPSPRPWLVPAVMVGLLLAMVLLAMALAPER